METGKASIYFRSACRHSRRHSRRNTQKVHRLSAAQGPEVHAFRITHTQGPKAE